MMHLEPAAAATPTPDPRPDEPAWSEVLQLLQRAAELAAARGVDSEPFMAAAWAAYLDARPGLREALEHGQLVAQLAGLRERGLLAQA